MHIFRLRTPDELPIHVLMTNTDDEKWLPVRGLEDFYEVSSRGSVRRLKAASGTRAGKPCKPSFVRGYARYALSFGERRPRFLSAHRLVYEAFVSLIPEGMQINHKNGLRADNRVENLEVMTPGENTRHSYDVLGKNPPRINSMPGESNPRAKVNWEQVREIRRSYATGNFSQSQLASDYGIDQTVVSRIILQKIWKEQQG